MADVFLSYARADAEAAKAIAQRLSLVGWTIWFDEQLPAHRPYADVIEQQLEDARAVLVIWSTASVQSQWVRSEANRARELGKLVQLRLDDARLPMPFDQLQCADLRNWRSTKASPGWTVITDSIAQLAETPSRDQPSAAAPATASRRSLLIGGGAATLLAGGAYLGWQPWTQPPMSPEAQLLLQKGLDALQANDALDPEDEGSTAQAIALLTEATVAAPRSPEAWGGLALAYAVRRRSAPVAEREGLAARGRAAATSALDLDPKEPRALAATQLMNPVYRNWGQAEADARQALDKNPRFPILLFVLSDILGSVGRWRDATQLSDRLDRTRFLIPGADRKVIVNLWAAGDLQAADKAAALAAERWPDQRQVWRTRIIYLLYSGRPTDALSLLQDTGSHPPGILPAAIAAATATAQALAGTFERSAAVAANLAFLRDHPERAPAGFQAAAALGDASTALKLMDGYYFGEGEWKSLAPAGGDDDRQTSPLFQPPMRSLWSDPGFSSLLQRIGLEDYWRASRTRPDFRASVA